jgi:hypothetical protein
MKESEAEFRAIADRDEQLLKVQQQWLIVFETRQKELQAIAEQLQARHRQSAQMHQSLADLHNALKDETARLAAQREELAVKERSLIEAQTYLLTVLEDAEPVPNEATPPTRSRERGPPVPPEISEPPAAIESPDRQGPDVVPEPEAPPGITKAEALDRVTRAIEASKRARDAGRDIGDIRIALKKAKGELDSGNYDTAAQIADAILDELHAALITK